MIITTKKLKEKLTSNVLADFSTGCCEWQGGGAGRAGAYGYIYDGDTQRYTHRVAYEMFNGEIPEGKFVLHNCDNPRCCNPHHLRVGTHQENMDDMVLRQRKPKRFLTDAEFITIQKDKRSAAVIALVFDIPVSRVYRIKGPQRPENARRLTIQQRHDIANDNRPTSEVMETFGVSRSTVCKIRRTRSSKIIKLEL